MPRRSEKIDWFFPSGSVCLPDSLVDQYLPWLGRSARIDYPSGLANLGDAFLHGSVSVGFAFRRQALHLYRSAADALVPALTGEPESWATIGLGEGTLPARETCQGECAFRCFRASIQLLIARIALIY